MTRRERLESIAQEARAWRRDLHRHPQTMYEETYASDLIVRKLSEWGIPFERGIAKTGVAATITGRRNSSGRAVAFRADIDALDLEEKSGQPWTSLHHGKMHGCGHDGHTATLLTLAKYLSETCAFDGIVRLIFQPAEEGGRGAFRMLEEGLLDRFPFDEIYGYHNWPGLPLGAFAIRAGAMLAGVDDFFIELRGKGGHAAMPHLTHDSVPAMAQLVLGVQTLVSREIDPLRPAVVSITNVHAGSGATNVIGDTSTLSGTVRTFHPPVRDRILDRMRTLVQQTAAAFDLEGRLELKALMTPTINHPEATEHARRAAAGIAGEAAVNDMDPVMGAEDFGGFLEQRPGAFIVIGQAEPDPASPHNHGLHSPFYDFNDALLPTAAEYFAELAESRLPLSL